MQVEPVIDDDGEGATSAGDIGYDSAAVPPGALFIECEEPLLVFACTAAAERHLEAIGGEDEGCAIAYGPKGEIYRIQYEGAGVRIEHSGEPDRPAELKRLLLHYLECCEDPGDATESLDSLVAQVWSLERDFWLKKTADCEAARGGFSAWVVLFFVLAAGVILYFLIR
jgi:hypothetical protein